MRGGRGGHANTAFSLVSPSKSRDELGRGKGGKALLVFLFFLLLSFCQVFGSEETLIVFFSLLSFPFGSAVPPNTTRAWCLVPWPDRSPIEGSRFGWI